MNITDELLVELLSESKDAATFSYSPYSNYRVGAAVATDAGHFKGANIENASSNLGICAERAAIAAARTQGARNIYAIAVYCLDATIDNSGNIADVRETLPCGACRQWLAELAPDAVVITNGLVKPLSVSELLPSAFRLPNMADLTRRCS